MKQIKIIPSSSKPFEIRVGKQLLRFDSRRKAIAEADAINRDLTEILSDINLIYCEFFIHARRMWLLEYPGYHVFDQIMDATEYYLNRSAAGHSISKPVENMTTVLDQLQNGVDEMKRFYQLRNHSALKSEIRTITDRIGAIRSRLEIYNLAHDSFLFLQKTVKCNTVDK